jgi:DNA replication protein DnaC
MIVNSKFPPRSELNSAHLSKLRIKNEEMIRLSKWNSNPKDFLLFLGSPGCGKTYFCAALINYRIEKNLPYVFLFERDFLAGLRNVIASGKDYNYDLEVLGEVPFLILDDMGSSQMTDWQKEALFVLVDNRIMSRLPTVITSNYYLKDIRSKFEPRFHSRLAGARNTIIELNDDDLRQVF